MPTIPNSIALWRPAVNYNDIRKNGRLETDQTSIYIRIATTTAIAASIALRSLRRTHSILLNSNSFKAIFATAVIIFVAVLNKIERWRATRALDQLAVDLFKKTDPVPFAVECYLRWNLSAFQKLVLQLPDSQLHKFTRKSGLLENIIKDEFSQRLHREQSYFPVLKLLVDKGIPLKTMDCNFLLTVLQWPSHFTLYALQATTIKPEDFTADEQIACWQEVRDDEVAQALIQKGFDINVKNREGITPVVSAIIGEHRSSYPKAKFLSFLLANGAILPDFQMKINLKESQDGVIETREITLEEFLKSELRLQAILQQASHFRSQQDADHKSSVSRLSDFEPSTFAIWKPAISIGGWSEAFKVRERAILGRTLLSAVSTCMLFIPVALMAPAYLPIVLPFIAMPYAYYRFERHRAIRALDELAVKEFQTMFPAPEVTDYIIHREPVMNQLGAKKMDLNKRDRDGDTLFKILMIHDRGDKWKKLSFSTKLSLIQTFALNFYKKKLTDEQLNRYFPITMKSRSSE